MVVRFIAHNLKIESITLHPTKQGYRNNKIKTMETFFDYMNSIYQKGIDDPPTDADIETWATHICGGCSQESLYERTGLISGAKWMRGILTQKQNQR